MEIRKQAILDALCAWINQRPGFDLNNYDQASYRSDSRKVRRQLHDARELLRAVELSSITADALIAAFPRAFSGRLTLIVGKNMAGGVTATLEYCTDQYWSTEFRAAACAVLASALWTHVREECMPQPCNVSEHGELYRSQSSKAVVSGGEWLRAHFRQRFGRGIASRWFS